MTNPVGRPTKYSDELIPKVVAYYNEKKEKNLMPYMEDIADICDIDIDTLETWINGKIDAVSDEFIGTVKKVKTLQRRMLINSGLGNSVNVIMSIFLLKANHGLVETSRSEITGKNGQPLQSESKLVDLLAKLLPKVKDGKQLQGINTEQSSLISEGEKKS